MTKRKSLSISRLQALLVSFQLSRSEDVTIVKEHVILLHQFLSFIEKHKDEEIIEFK